MADCKNCLLYNADVDEMKRSGLDVLVVGKEEPDEHFCFAYSPIPEGVFDGGKDCEQYLQREQA